MYVLLNVYIYINFSLKLIHARWFLCLKIIKRIHINMYNYTFSRYNSNISLIKENLLNIFEYFEYQRQNVSFVNNGISLITDFSANIKFIYYNSKTNTKNIHNSFTSNWKLINFIVFEIQVEKNIILSYLLDLFLRIQNQTS